MKSVIPLINITLLISVIIIGITSLACDKEVSVTKPKMPPPVGFVFIDSSPQNYLIYLNGRYTGRTTPDSIPFLEYAKHEIKLKKNLFRDSIFYVDVKDDEKLSMYIDYYSNPLMYGAINCHSKPLGANIYLNDSLTGLKTPDTLAWIFPGYYEIKYTAEEHRYDSMRVAVASSKVPKVDIALQDTSVWVDFQTINSGIPYDYLTDIDVDDNNIKWIGTSGLGLVGFDESQFAIFNPSNSGLPSGVVTCIDIDEMNNVWVGTLEGFAMYNGNAWSTWTIYNSDLPGNHVTDIESKDENNIWVATKAGLLSMQDNGGYYKIYNWKNSGLRENHLTSVELDQNGKLWVGTRNSGVSYFKNGIWGSFYNVDSTGVFPDNTYAFYSNIITALEVEPSGKVWIAQRFDDHAIWHAPTGFSFFDGIKWEGYISGRWFDEEIFNMYYDVSTDKKWICADDGLVEFTNINRYDPTTVTAYYVNNTPGLFSNRIRGIVKDKNGIIWITTSGGGLTKYKGEQF